MYDTERTQQYRGKTKKIGRKYVKLAVLFGLLLCWKIIYLISQPLGDSWANFVAYCWIFSIMLFYLKVTKQSLAKYFYSISTKLVFYGIGLGILLFVSGGIGYFLSQKVLGLSLSQEATQVFGKAPEYLWLFTLTMILTIISEEILFRGIFLEELNRDLPAFGAILISALCFSLFHLNSFNAISSFIYGIGLATVTLRTGSLWSAFIGHFVVNLTGIVMFILINIS